MFSIFGTSNSLCTPVHPFVSQPRVLTNRTVPDHLISQWLSNTLLSSDKHDYFCLIITQFLSCLPQVIRKIKGTTFQRIIIIYLAVLGLKLNIDYREPKPSITSWTLRLGLILWSMFLFWILILSRLHSGYRGSCRRSNHPMKKCQVSRTYIQWLNEIQ